MTTNITNSNWRYRDAAIMAFGSILEGPSSDKLLGIVEQGMPLFIALLKDDSIVVRDTTAWAIGRLDCFRGCFQVHLYLCSLILVNKHSMSCKKALFAIPLPASRRNDLSVKGIVHTLLGHR